MEKEWAVVLPVRCQVAVHTSGVSVVGYVRWLA